MKTNPILVAFLAFFAVLGPVQVANAGQTPCDQTVSDVLSSLTGIHGDVPSDVAEAAVHRVVAACASSNSAPAVGGTSLLHTSTMAQLRGPDGLPLPDFLIARPQVCAGGSTTIMGWSTQFSLAGVPFHVSNGPASSHYDVTYTDKTVDAANGHTRSSSDDFTLVNKNTATWFWFSFPMGGDAGVTFNCAGPIVTSVDVTLSGGIYGLTDPILVVTSTGTTCLVPC
jgi:hypothetical protein